MKPLAVVEAAPAGRPGQPMFTAESQLLRRAARPRARLRLICIPFAGGGASVFNTLPGLLPDAIEVVVVQLPGREDRSGEAPPASVPALARTLAAALRPYATMPYALYGHCAGALLAYEVAHVMADRYALLPRRLIAGAQAAPDVRRNGTRLHALSDEELVEVVRARGGIPDAVADRPALLDFLVPVLRADFKLWENYEHVPRAALPVPVTTMRGSEDSIVGADAAGSWERHTSAGVSDLVVGGGHYFIQTVDADGARRLADRLLTAQRH